MTTVACVLKLGGVYNRDWVHALKRGLRRHLTDCEFVCLTDDASVEPIWRVPLKHNWPGWWSKFELHRPGLFSVGSRILYMDLDTLPVGSLVDLAAYNGPFAMLSDFYQPHLYASGVMTWTAGETDAIYNRFVRDGAKVKPGRSDPFYAAVLGKRIVRLQDVFPGQIVSLKRHCNPAKGAKGPPVGARLVCFHGKPRPDDQRAAWAHVAWMGL
jgi:hypothetical protein